MTPGNATVLFTQESAIARESKIQLRSVTGRVNRPLQAIQPSNPPRAMLDRTVLFTESFKDRPICQVFGLSLTTDRTGHEVENIYGSLDIEFLTTNF